MLKTNKEIETKFKESLEETLDEYFPKIEEETPEKIVNKRGEALMLFTKALLLFREISHQTRIADLEEMEKWLIDEKEKFEPAYGLENEAVIFASTKILSHIQKLKEEITK